MSTTPAPENHDNKAPDSHAKKPSIGKRILKNKFLPFVVIVLVVVLIMHFGGPIMKKYRSTTTTVTSDSTSKTPPTASAPQPAPQPTPSVQPTPPPAAQQTVTTTTLDVRNISDADIRKVAEITQIFEASFNTPEFNQMDVSFPGSTTTTTYEIVIDSTR